LAKPKKPAAKTTAGKKDKSYKYPIPKRGRILAFLRDAGRPQKPGELFQEFGLKAPEKRALLIDKLRNMVTAGQVLENRGGEFCLVEKLNLVTGKVSGHRDGFGFVNRDDDEGDDVFLSAREMQALFHGDRVAIKVIGEDRRGRTEGNLVEVLERGIREIPGQFIRERGIGLVIPDNPKLAHRILVAKGAANNAKPGQIVVVRILDYPTHVEQATGEIIEVMGSPGDKGLATDISIQSHGIPTDWPAEVTEQAGSYASEVPSEAKTDRVDLRDTHLLTIDGADARDFDDAVFCEPAGSGFRLLVAIADVSHYVEKGSPLDTQAIRRGTSVYFPDRVVPMLPEALSNGLCSLNPNVDRLCMVCEMRVEPDGKVTKAKFYDAVMRSAARLTYSQVSDFFTATSREKIATELHEDLDNLLAVFHAFSSNRRNRGAIELDIPQSRIEMGPDGTVESIVAVQRNDAHRLIEECMIAANVQAAKFIRKNKIAGLYRNHAKPNPDRFDDLRNYLVSLGLKVPHSDHVEPRDFSKLIEQVSDRPDAAAISMAMLRSMSHAEYTPNNIGHFGLALDAYAHFTSPIRRYPDLLVHRAIRHITGGGKAGNYSHDGKEMEHLGSVCSAHERRAEEATRAVEAWLKCQFMEDKVGEKFPGVITGVTSFGAFVQISSLQIDGLVHVSSLANDYYQFDADSQALVGDRTGKRYQLGDALEIVVANVDLESKRIDFHLVDESAPPGSKSRKPKRKK